MRLHVQFSKWVLLLANQSFHSPYARDRNFSEGSTIIRDSNVDRQLPETFIAQRPFFLGSSR